MQHKMYIEIDEEITTVIDRLLRVRENNIVLVIPKNALLLQSVVNLKLLEKEMRKNRKNIRIMTNDENGVVFATRAGIQVQPFVTEEDEVIIQNKINQQGVVKPQMVSAKEKQETFNVATMSSPQKNTDANYEIGANSFLGQNTNQQQSQVSPQSQQRINLNQQGNDAQQINARQVTSQQNISAHSPQQRAMVSGVQYPDQYQQEQPQHDVYKQQETNRQNYNNNSVKQPQQIVSSPSTVVSNNNQQFNNEDSLDAYANSLMQDSVEQQNVLGNSGYSNVNNYETMTSNQVIAESNTKKDKSKKKKRKKKKVKKNKDVSISKSTSKLMKSFVVGSILLIIAVVMVIFLPKTDMSVHSKHVDVDESLDITAKTEQMAMDMDRRLIPARLIEKDITFTKTFDATGKGDVDAQKAQGTVIIYNEFSTAPQPLVATTRLLSESGVLFRIVNATTVPGMTSEGEPGKVEVLVAADKPGAEGNIGPAKFSIPGFEGGPKHEKIYAISEKAMTGGGTGGKNVNVVTQEDIDRAQAAMAKEVSDYVITQMNNLLRPDDEILLKEAVKQELIRSEASVSPGTMADQFMYEMVTHVKALVFSQNDVLAIFESGIEDEQEYTKGKDIEVTYTNVGANFDENTIKMTAKGRAELIAFVDVDKFKNSILGKTHEEIEQIMKEDYSNSIESIIFESIVPGFPSFISDKISKFSFMTEIEVVE